MLLVIHLHFKGLGPRPGGLVVSMLDSRPSGCVFETRLRRNSGIFSPLTSAEACKKSSRLLWKEICGCTGVRKPGNASASPTAMI